MKLQRLGAVAPDPEAGHENDDMVVAEGGRKGREGPPTGLGGVVDVVGVVPQLIHLDGHVDLGYSRSTMSPAV